MTQQLGVEAQLEEAIAQLASLTIFELRNEWRRHLKAPPPMRLSRDLLVRAIAHRLQEKAFGALPKGLMRRLETASASGSAGIDAAKVAALTAVTLKPGTRLVREWRGTTHAVLVTQDGFEWNGERHASLSQIACKITGAHWSGPRFFGIARSAGGKSRSGDRGSRTKAGGDHAPA